MMERGMEEQTREVKWEKRKKNMVFGNCGSVDLGFFL
jgi:hypothetical protein